MKHVSKLHQLLVLGCFLITPLVSHAAPADQADQIKPTTGLQVSLFHPAQWHSDDYSVDAFRFNVIYGVNEDLQGLDIGIINKLRGSAQGLELGMFNLVNKDFEGVQLGVIANVTRRSCEGFQAAVFFNDAQEEMQGLQLGIVNHTGSLEGIQIGLLNFNDDTRYLGFFPFINAAF